MKKLLAVVLCCILMLSVVACSDATDVEEFNFVKMNNQIESIMSILETEKDENILNMFPDGYLSDSGNILINGKFSKINGIYEMYCWDNQVYQIVFRWNEDEDISLSDVISDVNNCMGEYINHNEYWDIYKWKNDKIEISFNTEDGVWIEPIIGEKNTESATIMASSISTSDYVSITQESVESGISTIKNMMSYITKPKVKAFLEYSNLVDDDWNKLLIPGSMFGIDGQYVFMYDRETGIIDSVAFDWLPDNMEVHEKYIVHCLNMYFGDCTSSHNTEFNDEIYYYHDWDATTVENWSVHLSMTNEGGWLQFSQLKTEELETGEFICIECGKVATDVYINPFSNEEEHYCYLHYKEIVDLIGDMEEDVGDSNYSKHTCVECTRVGTHRYDSFTGQTEYYCTIHYEELMDMLEEIGLD